MQTKALKYSNKITMSLLLLTFLSLCVITSHATVLQQKASFQRVSNTNIEQPYVTQQTSKYIVIAKGQRTLPPKNRCDCRC